MLHLGKKVAAIKGGATARVKWLYFGDSYAQKIIQAVTTEMRAVFGGRVAAGQVGATGLEVTNNASSGTVTDTTGRFAVWPTGRTTTFGSAGASRTYGVGGVSFVCDTIKVVHANVGGGFKIQVDGVDNTTPTVTSDNSATVTTISVARGAHTVTLVQTSGTPEIIGVCLEDSTLSGAYFLASGYSGIALNSPTTQAWTNWTTVLADLAPDVVTWEGKESSSWLAAGLDSFLTATQAACSCDIVLVQSPPQASSNDDLIAQNRIIREKAAQYGVITWDSYSIFRSYAALAEVGWEADGLHISQDADRHRGLLMMRDLGLFALGLFDAKDTIAATAYLSDRLALGTPRAVNGALRVVTADIACDLARALDFRDSAGSTFAYFDSRNSTATPSTIPLATRVGAGPILYGQSSTALNVRDGSAIANYADVLARSFVARQTSANITGAASIAFASGAVQVLTLTGNVTSVAQAGLSGSGQRVTIHFVQDATGGRTMSGFASSFKWAGGAAPTWTTTANARDIVTFEVIGANLYEVSRSIDVK